MSDYTPPPVGTGLLSALPSLRSWLADVWDGFDLYSLAEGANIAAWMGVNGNVLSAASAYPTFSSGGINGSPMAFFNHAIPSNPLVCTSSLFSGSQAGFSMAMVLKVPYFSASFNFPIACIGTDSPPNSGEAYGNYSCCLLWNPTVTSNPGINVLLSQNNDLGGGEPVGKARVQFYRETVVVFTYDGTTSRLFFDGICVGGATTVSGNKTINGGCGIGPLFTDSGNRSFLSVGYSAFGVWRRGLSVAEARGLSAYWRDRFIQNPQPRIVFMGDSIAEGTSAAANTTLLDIIAPSLPGAQVYNSANGGTSFATQSSGATPYPEMYGSVRRGDVVVLFPGSIDIANNVAVATVEGYHTSIVASLRSQGAILVCPTMIDKAASVPADQTSVNTNRAAYNTWILGSSPGVNAGCDYVINYTGISQMSVNGAHTDMTYFLDGSHPTTVGYNLMAPVTSYRIQQALGYPTLANVISGAGITVAADGTTTPVTSVSSVSGLITAKS